MTMKIMDPLAAAEDAAFIVMLIVEFEIRTGFPFPYDSLKDDVAELKSALLVSLNPAT